MKYLILILFVVSCASKPVAPKATWRNAYLNRKPVVVQGGVPLYAEHMEYLRREVNYTCLSSLKPLLPQKLTNSEALDYCGCMLDKYYTKQELQQGLIKIDFNPTELVEMLKKTQDEIWAVLDDQFKNNYSEIAKYPPNYYERITGNSATCIEDINYRKFTKQGN